MKLDDFTLEISGGTERTNGQVLMKHGQEYAIILRNHSYDPADVELFVDGNSVGTFRANSHGTVRLERPENDNGKYTFFRLGSTEARLGGIQDNDTLGLITAVFRSGKMKYTPLVKTKKLTRRGPCGQGATSGSFEKGIGEMEYEHTLRSTSATPAIAMYHATGAGGTALSGHSAQRFNTVESLEYNGTEITINLRLVEDLTAQASMIRPITTRVTSNPIPPKA